MFKEKSKSTEDLLIAANQHIKERDYWLHKLSGQWLKSSFPFDYKDHAPEIKEPPPLEPVKFELSKELSHRLNALSNHSDSRLYIILAAGLYILLYKYTGNQDIIIGSPIYKQDINVPLINTVVALRNQINQHMTVKELLFQVRDSLKEAIDHYSYPIELLLEYLNLPYSEGEGDFPLFDVSLLLENIHDQRYIRNIRTNTRFCFSNNAAYIDGVMEYNPQCYHRTTCERIIAHFKQLLNTAFSNVETRTIQIDILTEKEKTQLLKEFNNNKRDFPTRKTIVNFVEEHSLKTPDRLAMMDEHTAQTYRQLNKSAAQLARQLSFHGIAEDQPVGILLHRSLFMVTGILASWKAGGAYIPIDPAYPVQRILSILNDSGAKVLITGYQWVEPEMEQAFKGHIILLDKPAEMENNGKLPGKKGEEHWHWNINMNSLAYVIYTSGSTGKPKGVMVEHIGMMNHIQAKINDLQMNDKSTVAQNASHTFDISVWQFFTALKPGGKTMIYPDELVLEPDRFITEIIKHQVTILEVVPSYLSVLLEQIKEAGGTPLPLDYLLVTGEEIKPHPVEQWFAIYPEIKMVNVYGPTEASDDITHYIMDKTPLRQQIPIGQTVQNLVIYIVNHYNQLCPIGVKGEIWVSGIGVGRGYLNDPEKTGQGFIKDPFVNHQKPRLYKTGDLGCWLPDGTIDFFGRKDYQLKVRGYRIEPGEIEAQILTFKGIKDVVVIDREDQPGEKYLAAYLITEPGFFISPLREYLHSKLPPYMVPAHFMIIEKFPLTPNGKINRKKLPKPVTEPETMIYITEEMLNHVEEPSTREEKELGEFVQTAKQRTPLGSEEKKKVLYAFNDTTVEYPEHKLIQQLFQDQEEQTPLHTAVMGEDTTYQKRLNQLTYKELNQKSNQLAHLLRALGIKSNTIIGIMVERSLEMIIGIWGILKAGAAFMPIDPEAPEERKIYLMKEADSHLLMINNKPEITVDDVKIINLNYEETFKGQDLNPIIINGPADLSHVLHTSGTTGKPKGVFLEHRAVVNLMQSVADLVVFQKSDRIISLTPITFDVFSAESLLPLTRGSMIFIANQEVILDYRLTAAMIEQQCITTVYSCPSVLQRIISNPLSAHGLRYLEYLLVAGEPLLEKLTLELKRKINGSIFNLYGPTETTIYSTAKDVTGNNTLSIGKPLYNTQIYILDKDKYPQPIGVIGELCIGGLGVSRGYLNRPQLTAEKFIPNPFIKRERGRIYKTGDLAKWLPDGNIEYIGRMDHQIKIGGVRIEPGEIENCLLGYPGINEAVVVVKRNENQEEYLCGCLVSEKNLHEPGLRIWLSQKIPHYMVPSIFVRLEKMPVTPNGKINRKLLAALKIEKKPSTNYIAPVNEVEIKLVEIWSQALNIPIETISTDDNFFELGGHSLMAITIIANIHKAFNVRLTLMEMFSTPTVKGITQYIKKAKQEKYAAIEPVEKKEYYVLSSAQKRLYVLQQFDETSTGYNIPLVTELNGDLHKQQLEDTFLALIYRHESLRTSFTLINHETVERVHDNVEFSIPYEEIPGEDRSGHPSIIEDKIKHFVLPFDLSQAPLLRAALVKPGEKQYLLLVDIHHIISDGVSAEILVQDFMALYEEKELPPLRLQYKDYAEWQKGESESNGIKQQEAFWLGVFAGEIPVLDITTDYPRPAVQSFAGSYVDFEISPWQIQALKRMALQQGATLYMLLLALFSVFLSKISHQEVIVIGTPVAGRRHADLEQIIGMFVNTLALKNEPAAGKPFNALFKEVSQHTLKAFENQDYPFEDLVNRLELPRDTSRNPLYDVMLALQTVETVTGTGDITREDPPGLRQHQPGYQKTTSKFDMTFTAVDTGNQLFFDLEYCTKLFKKQTMQRYSLYFKEVVSSVLEDPDRQISGIEIISPAEKQQVLKDFNETDNEYPANKTINRLFVEQVEKTPTGTALVYEGNKLTYRATNEKTNQLARVLRTKGVKANTMVGIMVPRSLEMIIGIIAVLKAGGTYLPIDPDYPAERINYMLEDSGTTILLCLGHTQGNMPFKGEIINLDQEASYSLDNSAVSLINHPHDMAYIIYTSGSTGKQKGVIIEHRSIVNTLVWRKDYYTFNQNDAVLQIPSFSFDSSVEDIFTPLISGASLVLIPQHQRYNLEYLQEVIQLHWVTHFLIVPGFYKTLLEEIHGSLTGLRVVTIAGEHFTEELVDQHVSNLGSIRLCNEYGPTENSVCSTIYEFAPGKTGVSIGKPIHNVTCCILDRNDNLNPLEIPGELCVSGVGLARGYLNNPELTREKFVSHPYLPGKRLYRTGDLARWKWDGNIDFLGRLDYQVKIRGFRVELGEIENRLLKYPTIKEVVVVIKEDQKRKKTLCAYFVREGESPPAASDLREYLSADMPDFMIPAHYVPLDMMPVTPNGKIDRKKLAALDPGLSTEDNYIEPQSSIEKTIAAIWQEVLQVEKVGINDNFFDLGANSLDIIKVNSQLKKKFEIDMPVVLMFRYPKISSLVRYFHQEEADEIIPGEEIDESFNIMEQSAHMLIEDEDE